ncbi:hypothetical protein [Priestia koreensis]|uniref:hypothetical protein n=1 Tax=Priestia koreensis TaxID=284581 RepID=UPI00146FDCDC|nr:hypothetical protein [Priestia koreensis]
MKVEFFETSPFDEKRSEEEDAPTPTGLAGQMRPRRKRSDEEAQRPLRGKRSNLKRKTELVKNIIPLSFKKEKKYGSCYRFNWRNC